MNWISIKDKKPQQGKYYLICSNCGWLGLARYQNNSWSSVDYPDVICNDVVYDVPNEDIEYYIHLNDIPLPPLEK